MILNDIHPDAQIGTDVKIGNFTTICEDVVIGDGTVIEPNVVVYPGARIGKKCHIFPGSVISAIPQDLKFAGEYQPWHCGVGPHGDWQQQPDYGIRACCARLRGW